MGDTYTRNDNRQLVLSLKTELLLQNVTVMSWAASPIGRQPWQRLGRSSQVPINYSCDGV